MKDRVSSPIKSFLVICDSLKAFSLQVDTSHSFVQKDSLDTAENTHVLISRIAEKAVGMCVLFDRGDRSTELKRMIVDAASRGRGVGMALLKEAEAQAMRIGALTMLLEVGARNTDAQQLYRRGGYQSCDPFLPYARIPISLFMTRSLTAAAPHD